MEINDLPLEHPLEELNKVNWRKLTEQQAAKFGISISAYSDAHHEAVKQRSIFFAKLSVTFVCVLIAVLGTAFKMNPNAIIIGMLAALATSFLMSTMKDFESQNALEAVSEELDEEIAELVRQNSEQKS